MRDAQSAAIEGRDGPDIREAISALRERSSELVAAATEALRRVDRQPGPGELNARLSQVAASETIAAQLRAGVLGSGDAAPDDLFADLQPAARPAPPTRATEPREAPAGDSAADRRAEAQRQRRLDALAAANEKHEATTAALAAADEELESAERAVAAAESTLRNAEKALRAAQAKRDKAADAAERTQEAVDRAGAQLG